MFISSNCGCLLVVSSDFVHLSFVVERIFLMSLFRSLKGNNFRTCPEFGVSLESLDEL